MAEDGTICDPPPWMADGGVTVEQGLAMMTTGSAKVDGVDVATLDGGTADGEELVIVLEIPVTGQVVRVTTTLSPSWVAWYEIEIEY